MPGAQGLEVVVKERTDIQHRVCGDPRLDNKLYGVSAVAHTRRCMYVLYMYVAHVESDEGHQGVSCSHGLAEKK